jgi:2-(1,2-epoxy-1,2-dihydrophenyl)acetyl-CoA isomerase
MRTCLQLVFQQVQDDPELRAIVFTGAGEDFCAGADVREMGAGGVPGALLRARVLQRMVRAVAFANKPVIAAVRGVCIGVAWSLALASDFIIAAEDARFQFAFRHIGLAPDGGAAFLLSRYIGLQRAKELIYSGRFVSGAEAANLGLALEASPAEQVMERAMELARGFSTAPTLALAMAKRMFDSAAGQTLDQALDFEAGIQPLMAHTQDFHEGTTAFMEKREAMFKGA